MAATWSMLVSTGSSEPLIHSGGARRLIDEQAAAVLHDRQRVEALLAVADGQRDIGRGQADGGQLGAGHRARAA